MVDGPISEGSQPRGYQVYDAQFVDYELYGIPGIRGVFRGPPAKGDEYVACVGAAQTFGRFVQTPYPRLIAKALGTDALNLGRGGAGPSFPLSNPRLLVLINSARVAIVQVFSGRSQSNSLFKTVNHGMIGVNLANGQEISANGFYAWLLEQGEELSRKIVSETRANYVVAMTELLDAITAPKILLWFSVRTPEYLEQLRLPLHRLWGEFPQLVNREMINEIKTHCDQYVECISRRGLPQSLRRLSDHPDGLKDFSSPLSKAGEKTENHYYPSPEMHEDAAALLAEPCRALLNGRSG
jgi:Domain of unknown function (DUF6473)